MARSDWLATLLGTPPSRATAEHSNSISWFRLQSQGALNRVSGQSAGGAHACSPRSVGAPQTEPGWTRSHSQSPLAPS